MVNWSKMGIDDLWAGSVHSMEVTAKMMLIRIYRCDRISAVINMTYVAPLKPHLWVTVVVQLKRSYRSLNFGLHNADAAMRQSWYHRR